MIENPPKVELVENTDAMDDLDVMGKENNKKKPITESDIMFEHLWKETTSDIDAPVGIERCATEARNIPTEANSPIIRGSKSHVVSGNMDFLSTRKGSAYVDYAKRSAHKFQKAKEEILNGDDLDKAASLSLAGGNVTESDTNPPVGVDVTDTADVVSPAISPASASEIVRVPTTEEKKSTPPKAESVNTSCMDTCVVM